MRAIKPQVLLISLAGIAVIISAYQVRQNYVASNIVCTTQYGPCSDEIIKSLKLIPPIKILTTLPEKEILNSLQKYSYIKHLSLSRELPSTILVTLEIRSPVAAISYGGGKISIIDIEGRVLGTSTNSLLPLVIDKTWQEDMIQASPTHVKSARLGPIVSQILGNTAMITLIGDTVYAKSRDTEVVIDPQKPIESWQNSLQAIVTRSKIGKAVPKKIDLRFNQPIIKY